jgi:ABC-type multidrug transport system fused ATPase/permease subunit
MVEIILLPHEIKDTPTAKELIVNDVEIGFKDLNFNFNETRQVLKNINLNIKPGEKVALIGPSGAGKTTFVRLLLRFYDSTSGQILIDKQDISKVTQESLRSNISLVPQDPVLFHRTLAENIAYGKRDATRQEIEKAASLAHCDEFIKELPYGLETYVGERGIKLSGGERQRVAIARAILKNAPILVLDEATSSLDSESEMLIQDALNVLMENKTVIVIAHRLSTIQKMDRIIVVDNGQIVEQGNHQELLASENSLYKKLWTLQAGGFIVEDENEPSQNASDIEAGEDEDNEDGQENGGSANFVEAKFTSF